MFAGKDNKDQGVGQLIECLKEYKERINLLEQEIAFYQRRNQLMRDALLKARGEVKCLQSSGSHHQDKARKTVTFPTLKPQRSRFFEFEWPKKVGGSIYISRTRLEKTILHQARIKIWGIEGVVVDFVRGEEPSGGPNWRICGIASGKVDAADALKAVQDAARSYETCQMVADGSHLDGRPIKARPRPKFENPPLPGEGSSIFPPP